MPYLTKRIDFSASHHYWLPELSEARNRELFGKCANPHGHGHDYSVEVTLQGEIHPLSGMLINFYDLNPILERAILEPLDHRNLNAELPFFQERTPTLENIVLYIHENLLNETTGIRLRLHAIKISESDSLSVEQNGDLYPMLTLTRRYTFSAAHRLFNPQLSAEENSRNFGLCGNLHGHNYTLEVTVAGTPNPKTGMILEINTLDQLVRSVILDVVDHKYLNEDVPWLEGVVSTVENVAQVFYQRLAPEISAPVVLHRVRLYESDDNWIEITSPGN